MEVTDDALGDWRLTKFYGFPERGRRRESWDLMQRLAALSPLPWCIIGDFNNLLSNDDKRGGVPYPSWFKDGFRRSIEDCGLVEVSLDGHPFTWAKNHGSYGWVELHLDRAFTTPNWGHLFPQAALKNLLTTVSDHSPICLDTTPRVSHFFQRKFKFENM